MVQGLEKEVTGIVRSDCLRTVDDVGFQHFIILPSIQINGKDKPITFFALVIDARS